MTTANDLIESAALKIGAKSTGETLTAAESTDCLSILNSMLDMWAINTLLVYQIVQTSYTWAAGQSSRTIGPGGNLSGTRPVRIEDGSLFRNTTDNIDIQVGVLRERESYDAIASKSVTTTYPEYLFYDPGYPLGTLYAFPTPINEMTLKLNTWQVLQSFSGLTIDLALPPGYQWAIEHNLAVAIEPVFSMPAPANVVREAKTSLALLGRANHRPITSSTEVSYVLRGGRRADIRAGG